MNTIIEYKAKEYLAKEYLSQCFKIEFPELNKAENACILHNITENAEDGYLYDKILLALLKRETERSQAE